MTGRPILVEFPEYIETERLRLRAPRPGDGAAVNAAVLESFDVLHRWMPWAKQRPSVEESEATVRSFHAEFIAREDLPLLIFARDGGELVGGTGLHRIEWNVPRFEIGYWIRRSCEGRGYATEAVHTLTEFALGRLGAARVEIRCSHRNERSQRVAERCGFTLEMSKRLR